MKTPTRIILAFLTFASPLTAQEEDFITGTNVSSLGNLYGNLVWSYACDGIGVARNLVKRTPVSGGTTFTHLSNSSCVTPTFNLRTSVVFDINNKINYIDGAGNIERKSRTGTTEMIGSAVDAGKVPLDGPVDWAGNFFFWTEDDGFEFASYSRLYRKTTSVTTGSPETVLDFSSTSNAVITRVIAHSATRVTVLTTGGDLIQANRVIIDLPPTPPFPVWLTTTIRDDDATSVTEHDGFLYYTYRSSDSRSVFFRRAPADDPTNSTLLHLEFNNSGHNVTEFDTDGEFLYYQLWQPGLGPLKRYEIGAGPAVEIGGPYTSQLNDLREENSYLFWIKNATTVARLPVNAAAIQRDLAVTDMEVMQVVQDLSNSVPLIAGKDTMVRVFTRLLFSSAGEVAIDAWPGVYLYGSRGGMALPGSPLVPLRANRLTSDFKARTNPAHGFRFRLPESWTSGGPVTLTGRVNPTNVFNDTTPANDSQSFVADFEIRDDICVIIHPLRHRLGNTGGWSPELQRMFTRAEKLLPTPQLRAFFQGGGPMSEYEFPFGSGPYEISDDDNDTWKILFKLKTRQLFTPNPGSCPTHYAGALFNTSGDRALNGVASGKAFVNYINLGNMGSPDTLNINTAISGVTLAHELGHNHDRKHVDFPMGAPADPDGSYPHIWMGIAQHFASVGIEGYDPISNQYFPWTYAGDLMSYAHQVPKPRWPSDYTWTAIRNKLGVSSPTPPPSGAPPPPGIPGSACIVGVYRDAAGNFEMDYAWKMDAETQATAITEFDQGDINDFEMVGIDDNGQTIFTVEAPGFFINDQETETLFFAILPEDPSLLKIELRKINDPNNQVFAVRTAGLGAPNLALTSPLGGEFFTPNLVVEWVADDPENDEMCFQVRYSCDAGVHWIMLGDDLREQELVVPVANLGGSKNCLVEVTASDGLHSTVVTSNIFEVPANPPQTAMFYDLGDGLINEVIANATVAPGQPVTFHGHGYDTKDGSLFGNVLQWSLTGAESRNGSGDTFFADDLKPGTYLMSLSATNSGGLSGTSFGQLVVTPKFVPADPNPVVLDGLPADFAYGADEWAIPLRYADEEVAQLRAVHHAGNLYLTLSGIPNGTDGDEHVSFYLDPTGAGTSQPATGHFRFRVYPDGSLVRAEGTGTGWATTPALGGVQSRINRNATHWSVELCLPDSFTGGYSGQTILFAFAHDNRDSVSDDTIWPRNGNPFLLSTWIPLVLGADPDDPTDGDGDGMADAYEIATFGDTKKNAGDDEDNDGQTNLEECIAGTNPLDGASFFQVDKLEMTLGQGNTVEWTGQPGRSYVVRRSTDLLTDWIQIGPALPGGGTLSINDPNPPPIKAFYQIVVTYPR